MTLRERDWLLAGLLVAGGYGLVRVLTARPRVGADTRLMLIGDSLAQGLSPQMNALATDARVPYVGRGVPSTRIDEWATSPWLDRNLAEFQPTLVLVSLGTNDAYMGGDVWERQAAAYETLLQKLRAAGAEIVWIGPPMLPDPHLGVPLDGDFLMTLAEVAPSYFPSHEYEIPRGPDNLHPTVAGYAGWAGAIWAWLT